MGFEVLTKAGLLNTILSARFRRDRWANKMKLFQYDVALTGLDQACIVLWCMGGL